MNPCVARLLYFKTFWYSGLSLATEMFVAKKLLKTRRPPKIIRGGRTSEHLLLISKRAQPVNKVALNRGTKENRRKEVSRTSEPIPIRLTRSRCEAREEERRKEKVPQNGQARGRITR